MRGADLILDVLARAGVDVVFGLPGGTIAPAIVRDLAESGEVSGLILLDVHKERAEAVAREHGGSRAQVRTADARSGLSGQLGDCDVLVNSASYRVNLDAMRACLAAGCMYIDLGGLYWMTSRQLEMDPHFGHAGLLALLGMGASPGKTNVMAARAVRELGERPAAVHGQIAGLHRAQPDGALLVGREGRLQGVVALRDRQCLP